MKANPKAIRRLQKLYGGVFPADVESRLATAGWTQAALDSEAAKLRASRIDRVENESNGNSTAGNVANVPPNSDTDQQDNSAG